MTKIANAWGIFALLLVACNLRVSYDSSDLCLYNYADKINSELIIQLDQLAVTGVTITDN